MAHVRDAERPVQLALMGPAVPLASFREPVTGEYVIDLVGDRHAIKSVEDGWVYLRAPGTRKAWMVHRSEIAWDEDGQVWRVVGERKR